MYLSIASLSVPTSPGYIQRSYRHAVYRVSSIILMHYMCPPALAASRGVIISLSTSPSLSLPPASLPSTSLLCSSSGCHSAAALKMSLASLCASCALLNRSIIPRVLALTRWTRASRRSSGAFTSRALVDTLPRYIDVLPFCAE